MKHSEIPSHTDHLATTYWPSCHDIQTFLSWHTEHPMTNILTLPRPMTNCTARTYCHTDRPARTYRPCCHDKRPIHIVSTCTPLTPSKVSHLAVFSLKHPVCKSVHTYLDWYVSFHIVARSEISPETDWKRAAGQKILFKDNNSMWHEKGLSWNANNTVGSVFN